MVLAQRNGIFRRGELNLVRFKDREGRETFIDLKTREPFEMDAENTFGYSSWLRRPYYESNWIFNWYLLKSIGACDPYIHPEVPREALESLYAKVKKLYDLKLNGANRTKKKEFRRLMALYFPKEEVEKNWDLEYYTYDKCVEDLYSRICHEEYCLRDFLNYKYDSFLVAETR